MFPPLIQIQEALKVDAGDWRNTHVIYINNSLLKCKTHAFETHKAYTRYA
jgi:hypothetical protein